MQITLFGAEDGVRSAIEPFKVQLLKWIGNKQRLAHEIAAYFPTEFGALHEPFLAVAR